MKCVPSRRTPAPSPVFLFSLCAAAILGAILPQPARAQRTERRGGAPPRYTSTQRFQSGQLRIQAAGAKGAPSETLVVGWHNPPKVSLLYLSGATKGSTPAHLAYQVTMTPPPPVADGWQNAPDQVTTVELPAAQAGAAALTVPLDTAFLPRPPSYPEASSAGAGAKGAAKGGLGSAVGGSLRSPRKDVRDSFKPIRITAPVLYPPAVGAAQVHASGQATYYVRMVATDAKGEGIFASNPVRLIVEEEAPPASAKAEVLLYRKALSKGDVITEGPSDFHPSIYTAQRLFSVRYRVQGASPARVFVQVNRTATYDPQRWSAPELNTFVAEVPPASAGNFSQYEVTLPKTFPINKPKTTGTTNTVCYVHLIALKADGSLAAVPGWASILLNSAAMGDAPPPPDLKVDAPPPTAATSTGLSVTRTVEYLPERRQKGDDIYHFVTTRDLSRPDPKKISGYEADYQTVAFAAKLGNPAVIPAGTKFFLAPGPAPEKSLTDYITEFVSSVYDFIAECVNWISQAYTDLQNGLVSFVADATGLPPSLVRIGLQFALSSLGLPPTLPNMDQLMDQGLDYLTEQAVSQMGVPVELQEEAKAGMKAGLKEMAASLRTGGPSSHAWKPDPDFGNIPPRLVIRVTAKWNGADPPPAGGVQLDPVSVLADTTISDPETPGAQTQSVRLFQTKVPLPPLKGGENLMIPVCLTPVFVPHYNLAYAQNAKVLWRIGGDSRTEPVLAAWK